MEISISSFSFYEVSLASARLHSAHDAGMLSSSECLMALHLLDEMIEAIESGIPREIRIARPFDAAEVHVGQDHTTGADPDGSGG